LNITKVLIVDLEGREASESNWRAAEFHADAAGGPGVWRRTWVCFPVAL